MERRLYVDIDALLNGGAARAARPIGAGTSTTASRCSIAARSTTFGDPESGKTWVCLAAAGDELRTGGTVAVIDLDHNGPEATVARLVQLGAPLEALEAARPVPLHRPGTTCPSSAPPSGT